ncbi:MAG: tyrosine-protein phosphatase [Lachnospiraceae bacterium]|nr:tyrosine-protein phosphatase [Lachnospiraceae bacterium]
MTKPLDQRTASFLFALVLSIVLCVTAILYGGQAPADEPLKTESTAIIHEPEFGGVYITITIEDFNALGFEYGDSVDVVFSNGYRMDDIPYFSGYYVDVGEPLLIAYPGYDYIKAAVNYGADVWETGQLNEDDTAEIRLRERGKYLDTQKARDIHYYDERERYDNDVSFANFRNIRMGSLKEGILYRSASPCDNQHNRAPYADALMKEAGVLCVLDLADTGEKIDGYIAKEDFNSPWFLSLYEKGQVIPLAMSMNFASEEFTSKIAQGFTAMSEFPGPYLVHCTEGKDRTGFVCMLIEALAGASYQEIVDDYMKTYDEYYRINEASDPERYRLILEKNLLPMIRFVAGDDTVDITTADLAPLARDFLVRCGMTEAQIDRFLARITG